MSQKHEEYKGYIIAPGITMPAQGIYDYDVFESLRDLEEDKPVTTEKNRDAAVAWVDRVVGTISRVGTTWWSEYDYTESPAPFVSNTARNVVGRMPPAEQDIFRMVAAIEQTDDPDERLDRINETLSKMEALGITPHLSEAEKREPGAVGAIEGSMLRRHMSDSELELFKVELG